MTQKPDSPKVIGSDWWDEIVAELKKTDSGKLLLLKLRVVEDGGGSVYTQDKLEAEIARLQEVSIKLATQTKNTVAQPLRVFNGLGKDTLLVAEQQECWL